MWYEGKGNVGVLGRRIGAAVAIGIATFASSAEASPSARLVYLRGNGADGCPDEAALRAAVAARLGYDPFFPWAPDTVFAEVTRPTGNGGYRAEVKLVDADNRLRGSRELKVAGGDCAAAIDAMALSISLAIDPSSLLRGPKEAEESADADAARARESERERERQSEREREREREREGERERESERERERERDSAPTIAQEKRDAAIRVGVGVGVIGAVGAAPAASFGGVFFVDARRAWLSLALEGRADLTSGAQQDAAYVRSSLLAASLVPCAHLDPLFACAVITAGELRATSAVAVPRDDDAAYGAAGGRVGVLAPLSGPAGAIALRLHAELLATLTRPTLAVDGAPVYSYGPASADLGAALVVRFP